MNTPPKHAPRVPFAILVGGLVVGGLCLLLALNTASAANELDRHDLAAKDAAISAKLQQLQNEVAASAAPGVLAAAATRLGMVPAGNPAFLVVGKDGKVTVLGRPAPVTGHAVEKTRRTKTTHTNTAHPTHTAQLTHTAKTSTAKTHTAKTHTAKTSTAKTSTAKTSTAKTSTAKTKATSTPTPTHTPTPTTTLGGGPR